MTRVISTATTFLGRSSGDGSLTSSGQATIAAKADRRPECDGCQKKRRGPTEEAAASGNRIR